MNPAFFILLAIILLGIWVLCVFIFTQFGGIIKKIIDKIKTTINDNIPSVPKRMKNGDLDYDYGDLDEKLDKKKKKEKSNDKR